MTEYFERDGKRWLRTEISLSDVGLPFPIPPIVVEPPPTAKLLTPHSVVNGAVKLTGVDSTNMVLWDNEFSNDTPEDELLMLMADKGKVNLAGFVITNNPDPNFTLARIEKYFTDNRDYLVRGGMKNIPVPVLGSSSKLVPTGNIDTTIPSPGLGVDLIISSAHKCTAEKPLLIFVGGQCTSVASAYLKDKSIAPKVIVFHTDGWFNDQKSSYNLADKWSAEICMKRMKYVVVNSNQNPDFTYWWTGKNMGLTQAMIDSLPAHPAVTLLKNWYRDSFAREGMADASPVLWWLDNTLWKSVQRRKQDGSSTPNEDYDYLFITGHDWPKYGAVLIDKFKELLGVTSVPETPPVIVTPIGGITSGFHEAIRTAGQGRTVVWADGLYRDIDDITNVPQGVSIMGRAPGVVRIIPRTKRNYTAGSDNSDAWLKLHSESNINGDQKVSNLIIQSDGALGGVLVNRRDNVALENIEVSNSKFFGVWTRFCKGLKVKGMKLTDNSWASDGWASGEFCYVELDDFDISDVEVISTVPTRGYGFKAIWGEYEQNGQKLNRNMGNGRFSRLKSNLNHQSAWQSGKSHNIGFEMHGVHLLGNIEMLDCYWENQVSLHTKTCSPGSFKVINNEWNGENDRYAIEGIICNLEVRNCLINNTSQWLFNGQRNFRVNNWRIHNNTYNQGTAPNTGWGAVVLFGGEGCSNVDIRGNTIRKRSGNDFIKYQGTQGGVNADHLTANTITNF